MSGGFLWLYGTILLLTNRRVCLNPCPPCRLRPHSVRRHRNRVVTEPHSVFLPACAAPIKRAGCRLVEPTAHLSRDDADKAIGAALVLKRRAWALRRSRAKRRPRESRAKWPGSSGSSCRSMGRCSHTAPGRHGKQTSTFCEQ